jgi:LysM repeat protein
LRTFKPKPKTSRPAISGPAHAGPDGQTSPLIQLQRSVGNQAVQRILQTKLTIGAPGDRYEQEADRVADQVVRSPEATSPGAPGAAPAIQPLGGGDAHAAETAGPELESRLEARRGQGNPMPPPLRAEMESSFGADFGGVRLHADGEAAQLNRQIQAEAFTYGSDIYLGKGGLDAGSQGRRLLAHELTHTIQQGAVPGKGSAGKVVNRQMIQRSCHTVKANDTLYNLSKKYGVTIAAICDANGIKEADTLPLGKMLIIPDGKSCAYTVKDEDTLYSLSKVFGTTIAAIKAANGLKSNQINEGEVLSIPVGGTAAPTPKPPVTTPATKPPATTTPAVKPPATGTATSTPGTTTVTPAAGTSLEAGHEPGKDYASGTLRSRTKLRESDKKKVKKSGSKEMFFEAGDTVTLKSSDASWIEVEGTAFTDQKKPASAGKQTGWIERSATTMSLGDYKDLKIEDLTGKYGKLAAGDLDKSDVNNVILHQTGGTSGANTLSAYDGRIKSNSSIGAQYLIDENGNIKLVVPVDKKVSHVGKTKPGFDTASNSHAVGIEHTGAPTELDVPKDAKDTTTLATIRADIKAMSISPDLKARVLALTDAQLTRLAKDNRPDAKATKWSFYGDINPKQKRSSFLLTNRLKTDFGLANADLLPHETVSWKTIGEGENIQEFLTAATAYPGLVTQLETTINGDAKLKSDASLIKILDAEKATVGALAKDATAAENTALAAEKTAGKPADASAREDLRVKFYDKFWPRVTQLKELLTFLKANGSSKPADLAKKIAAWKS